MSPTLTDPGATAADAAGKAARRSRLWRTSWRIHFYAGMFAMPILLLFSLTGLVILYTDQVNDLQFGDVRVVEPGDATVPLDDQRAAVEAEYEGWTVTSVTPPREANDPTLFALSGPDEAAVVVSVDPYRGEVLGEVPDGGGLVGLANRLHGFLNNETVTAPLPTLAGVMGDQPGEDGSNSVTAPIPVTEIVLEVAAVWGLVLALTGIFLWWPRKSGAGSSSTGRQRSRFLPRKGVSGRARWRDIHAVSGFGLAALLVFFVVTGMPWSSFWGSNWSYAASKATPNEEVSFWGAESPNSEMPKVGDIDRVGNRIPWATREDAVPASGDAGHDHSGHSAAETSGSDGAPVEVAGETVISDAPAAVSLDTVAAAAQEEGMLAGYTINLPVDDLSDPETPVWGSYVVMNPWPSDISNQGAVYLDQFSAETIGTSTAETWGALQWSTELGVQTHMGTQFGIWNRIAMTLGCLLIMVSSVTALVMWWKRRPKGGMGLPRRPVDTRLQWVMIAAAVALAIFYPLWGVSLVVVLLLDKFIVQKVPPLRRTFGMADPLPAAASGDRED